MPRILLAAVEPLACVAIWAWSFAVLLFVLVVASIFDQD